MARFSEGHHEELNEALKTIDAEVGKIRDVLSAAPLNHEELYKVSYSAIKSITKVMPSSTDTNKDGAHLGAKFNTVGGLNFVLHPPLIENGGWSLTGKFSCTLFLIFARS